MTVRSSPPRQWILFVVLLLQTAGTIESRDYHDDIAISTEEDTVASYNVPLPLDLQPDDLFITYRNDDMPNGGRAVSHDMPQQRHERPGSSELLESLIHRILEIGDFQRFNELFANAQLLLPPAEVSESGLTLNIQNLICTGISIGDIQTNYTVFADSANNNQDTLAYTVSAYPVSITCSADYTFDLILGLGGKGRFTAVAAENLAEARIDLFGDAGSFMNGPPTNASVEYCNAAINTNGNISFEGATIQRILTLFKQLISNLVDKYAAEAVCNLLSESGPTLFNDLLNETKVRLDTWLSPGGEELTNPLYTEQTYDVPEDITLIHLQNPNSTNSSVSEMFVRFLKQADTLFGNTVVDPVSGESDLGINSFLRKTWLDNETGAWNVDFSKLSTFNPVILESHGKLTQSSVVITGAKIVGIDTLQTFNPFVEIGAYTVSNTLSWESLSMEIAMTVDIKPSTRSDSILYNPDPVNIIENIIIRVDFTNVNVDVAIFMPIDQTKFENIMLGSILSTKNILPCFLATMTELEVSGLNVTIADISVPTLEGFVSPGIDRVVSQLAEAAFLAYEPTLLRALPGLFQGPIRTMLKMDSFLEIGEASECPQVTIEPDASGQPATLDFRDLFLQPDDAIAAGATGQQPYGNIGYLAYDLILDRFNEVGANGLPKINELVIDSFTKSQSGVPGLIEFPSTLFKFGGNSNTDVGSRNLADISLFKTTGALQFSLGNISVNNVNSIAFPMELLNFTDSPSVLRNKISMGVDSPLNITLGIAAGFDGTLNEIDIVMSIGALSLAADIGASLDANRFLQFPLGNIMNYNCWLSALPPVELNSEGFAFNSSIARSLSLVDFTSTMSSFFMTVQCKNCISPGTKLLPELVQILEDVEAISTLGNRLPSFLNSLAMSSTTQSFFDRLVADAPKFCPGNPLYSVDAVKAKYAALGFPALTSESIDTLLYTGILAVEVAFIVFAETQRQSNVTLTSPLSAQDSFDPPGNVRLLDWTDIGNSTGLGATADQIFNQLRGFLGGAENSGFDFDKILGGLLNEDGSIELQTNFEWENEGIVVALDSVRIHGLDNFSLGDILEPIGAQTLSLSAKFNTLDIDLVLSASVPSSADPPQIVAMSLSMQNVSASIAIFVAVDLDKLGALELGSLFETKSILQCLLSTTHAFEIPQMKITVGSFSNPSIEGLQADTGAAITLATETLFNRFKPDIIEAIPKIFDGVGKDFLSNILDSPDERSCQAVIREPLVGAVVDFRDLFLPQNESISLGGSGNSQYGNLISSIFTLIKEEMFAVDPKSGLAAINTKLIDDFTQTQSGTPGRLFFPGDLLSSERRVRAGGLDAKVRLRAYDAYINNLDTMGTPLTILEPISGEPNMLNNSAEIGVNRTLQLGIRFFFGISNEESDIANEVEIRLDMKSLKVLLTALATVSEKAITTFPVKDILNLQCWLATIPAPVLDARGVRVNESEASLSVSEFLTSIEQLGMNVTCVDCSGPGFTELTELLSSDAGADAVTNVANGLFDLIPKLIEGKFLQVATDRALNNAKLRCPHSSEYDPNFSEVEYEAFDVETGDDTVGFFLALCVVGGVLAAATLSFVITTKCIVRRRHRKWISSLGNRKLSLIWKEQQKDDDRNSYMDNETRSMFQSKTIPKWLRWTMPLIILGNIGFFLSGHLSLAASVTILASIGGQTFSEEGFFEFSVAKSTIEIWNAGGEELAILIFIFSFVWPYVKTILTLALWFVGPSKLSVKRRGSILLWLDFLAKWSTIDIFVLIVTIVSFRVSVKSPDVAFLPADFYSLDLLVSPKWGLYANLMAQIISQISSHFIIHYHRRIVEVALTNVDQDIPDICITGTAIMDEEGNENDNLATEPKTFVTMASDASMAPDASVLTKSRLCATAFKRPHRGDTDKLIARRLVSPMLVVLAICCIVLIIVGCIMPTYSVSAYGIVGVLVESGQKFSAAEANYSVFTTISLLFEQARLTGTTADFIGLGSLSVILLLSVLVVPIAQSLVLLVQWFAPLTRKRRNRLMILLEILQAWQYAEVYLLAIIVGSWQLGPISAFMINPYCSSLKGFFSEMVYYGILKDQDAQCFQTDVQVLPMFYLLFAGTIALALINSFVMKAITQYVRDSNSSTLENQLDLDDIEGRNKSEQMETGKIHPIPVLFTDQYRWLLQREDTPSSSQQCSESFENSDIMKEPSYADSADNMEDRIPKKMTFYTGSGNKIAGPDEQSFDDGSIYTCTNTNEPNWKN